MLIGKLIGILSAERATEVVNYNYLRQYKSFFTGTFWIEDSYIKNS